MSKHASDDQKMNDVRENLIIFCDEVSIVHKNQLNVVDKFLQQIHDATESFGEVKIALVGGFRQILAFVKDVSRNNIYKVVIKRYNSWSRFSVSSLKINVRSNDETWSKFIENVGNEEW